MTEKEYKEHIQYTHNAYCRIVIRHASIDAARMLYAKWKREISLEYLSEEKFMPFGTTDEYFAQPPINEDYPFTACGQIVLLSDPALAAALSMLFQGKQPHQAAQPEKAGSRVCAVGIRKGKVLRAIQGS